MIHESHPWKRDIARTAAYFSQLQTAASLTERQCVAIEKRSFVTFYSIRKLIEAKKLSDQVTSQQTSVFIYPPTGRPVTHINWHRSDEHFHPDQPHSESWDLLRLCHQFVHRYVFHIMESESGGFLALMVASDHQRTKGLLRLDVEDVVPLFHSVASDHIVSMRWQRDIKTGKEAIVLLNAGLSDDST
jgi:hypothetical protein